MKRTRTLLLLSLSLVGASNAWSNVTVEADKQMPVHPSVSDPLYFEATTFTSDEEGGAVALGSDDAPLDLTKQNLLFEGTGTTTISDIYIDNSVSTGASQNATSSAYATVIASGAVVLDGVTAQDGGSLDLQSNLSIGTAYTDGGTATLTIQGGSKVATSTYYNVLGGNGSKGVINVVGGSELKTNQITIGGGTAGLHSYTGSIKIADDSSAIYWRPTYFMSDEQYADAVAHVQDNYSQINISEGSTMVVGEGCTSTSWNKLQLYNGEINVSGEGASLILHNNVVVNQDPWYQGTSVSGLKNSINVTDGGRFATADGASLYSYTMGMIRESNELSASIVVDGENSSLDLKINNGMAVAYVATEGSEGAAHDSIITRDGATATFDVNGYITIASAGYGQGCDIDVDIQANSGSTLNLLANNNSIYINSSNNEKTRVNIAVTEGSEMTLAASENIYIGQNTTISVEGKNSTLHTEGNVNMYSNATATVGEGASWEADAITLSGSATLVNEGSLTAKTLNTSGGKLENKGLLQVTDGTELGADSITSFMVESLTTSATEVNYGWGSGTYSQLTLSGGSFTLDATACIVLEFGGNVLFNDEAPATQEFTLYLVTGISADSLAQLNDTTLTQLARNTSFVMTSDPDGQPQGSSPEGGPWDVSVTDYAYSLVGNNLVLRGILHLVPEPSTVTLSLLALGALAGRRRRR